jgi:bacterioferritin-associated ferredoxin
MPYLVTRCLCEDRSFAELGALAAREGIGADEVCRRTGCGMQCGRCVPYIRAALATGVTALPVMSVPELEAMAARGGAAGRKENGPDA